LYGKLGQVEQHTSPFELQQMSTLFANFGKKFKHETVDNIPDLAPAVIIFAGMIAYVSPFPSFRPSSSLHHSSYLTHPLCKTWPGCVDGARGGEGQGEVLRAW